jgi:hypothetical protein
MWRVDLVGENILGSRLGDRQVEASQQFSQGCPWRITELAQNGVFASKKLRKLLPKISDDQTFGCTDCPEFVPKRCTGKSTVNL